MERSEWFTRRRATIAYYSRFGLAIVNTIFLLPVATGLRFKIDENCANWFRDTSRVLTPIFRT